VLTNQSLILGANTWSSLVDYGVGIQPVDSTGANYETPLIVGSISYSATVTGYRKAIYGTDSVNSVTYTTSNQVRLLSGGLLNPVNGSTFTINILAGVKMVVFAYPATLRDTISVKYVEGFNAEIVDVFTKTTLNVEGANGYTAVSYKLYTFIPPSPFENTATYNVTI
jgi:hypothetical protein